MTNSSDTQKMRVKDHGQGIKEQVPKNEQTQGERNKIRQKIGFGLSNIKAVGRLKTSLKRDKKKSQLRSNDEINESERVDSTGESRDKTEANNHTRLSPADTRTTVSSHFELPNTQQEELLQLSNENTKLQERINKGNDDNQRLQHEILKQRMEFQQQKNDLEQQIQSLRQELTMSESARMESLASPNQVQNKTDSDVSPMVVDFAGGVVPLVKTRMNE